MEQHYTSKRHFWHFLIFDIFFYIYIYYREFNVEFNNLIKTVGHRARLFFFRKMMLNTPTPTILTLFGYFHMFTY